MHFLLQFKFGFPRLHQRPTINVRTSQNFARYAFIPFLVLVDKTETTAAANSFDYAKNMFIFLYDEREGESEMQKKGTKVKFVKCPI